MFLPLAVAKQALATVGWKSAWQTPCNTRHWHLGAPTHGHLPEVRYHTLIYTFFHSLSLRLSQHTQLQSSIACCIFAAFHHRIQLTLTTVGTMQTTNPTCYDEDNA